MHAEFRPRAEQRVKTLLVLSKIADAEGTNVADAEVEAEIAEARLRYADDPKTVSYFASTRGRNFIRSTLRRTRTVESLVDAWLADHPEHPALPHAEEAERSTAIHASAAAIDATDPSAVLELGDEASAGTQRHQHGHRTSDLDGAGAGLDRAAVAPDDLQPAAEPA